MNATITASTTCPPIIFANNRTASTPCLTNVPKTSMTKIIGTNMTLSPGDKSIWGTNDFTYPAGPSFVTAENITVKNVTRANAPVVASEAVGEPSQGTKPNKLQA